MTAPPRPDGYVHGLTALKAHLAAAMGEPEDRIGHVIVVAQITNPSQGADLLICCPEMMEHAADVLYHHAAQLDARAERDTN